MKKFGLLSGLSLVVVVVLLMAFGPGRGLTDQALATIGVRPTPSGPAVGLDVPPDLRPSGGDRPSYLPGTSTSTLACSALFSYAMPKRFGLDANNNGILDLPNSLSYVTNGFVPLKSNPSAMPTFTVQLTPTVPFTSGTWQIRTTAGSLVQELPATFTPLSVRLAEGTYRVRLSVSGTDKMGVPCSGSSEKDVKVEDFLIVVIGDSYASGEGNPERRTQGSKYVNAFLPPLGLNYKYWLTTRWADDGSASMPPTTTYKYYWPQGPMNGDFGWESDWDLATVPARWVHRKVSGATPAAERHLRAHRSSAAWPVQLALAMEDASAQSSVTFVSLAATGATIRLGLVECDWGGPCDPGMPDGQQGSLDEYADGALPSQLSQLSSLIGPRQVDLLLISIGGNDVGFSRVLASLLLRGTEKLGVPVSDLTPSRILTAVNSGDWASLERNELNDAFEFLANNTWIRDLLFFYHLGLPGLMVGSSITDPSLQWGRTTGMLALPDAYAYLSSQLNGPGPLAGRIRRTAIVQYPSFGTGPDGLTCSAVLAGIASDASIDDWEIDWARDNVLHPLNDRIADAAARHGWTLIDGIEPLFSLHGLCASGTDGRSYSRTYWPNATWLGSGRWFRRAEESVNVQGSARPYDEQTRTYKNGPPTTSGLGTAHPNESGHKAMANRAYDVTAPLLGLPARQQ